jgi:hypothetical protein
LGFTKIQGIFDWTEIVNLRLLLFFLMVCIQMNLVKLCLGFDLRLSIVSCGWRVLWLQTMLSKVVLRDDTFKHTLRCLSSSIQSILDRINMIFLAFLFFNYMLSVDLFLLLLSLGFCLACNLPLWWVVHFLKTGFHLFLKTNNVSAGFSDFHS